MLIDNLYPVFKFESMGNKPSSAVHTCLRSAVKDVVFPSDPLFGLKHVKPYNLGVTSKPSAVTYPKSTDDIAKIVKCAVDNSLKVQARCGGHSFANYGA
jgi:FAD/FMN-containing dehydrogenase